MGASQFVPLEAELIDEGQFMQTLNDALREAQKQLRQHARKWGEKAKKSKAEITVKIAFVCLEPEQDAYGLSSAIKTTLPSAPPAVTMLMGGEDQTGDDALFCRRSGSSSDHPVQAKLSTKDGRTIDTATGEIMAEVAKDEDD